MKRIKTIAVAAGVAAAATSLSVGAWAATGDAHPASKSKKAPAARPAVNAAAAPADATTSGPRSKSAPTGLVKGGRVLKPGTVVRSPNEKYGLVQQTDGNLVLYRGKKALWSTVTGRHPGAASVMQTDGNLVVYGKDKKALWSSNTGRHAGAVLAVQNDGNLVIYSKAKKALWSRHVSLGSLQPGYVLSAGEAVRSMNGAYSLLQQTDGNLVLYRGKKVLWNAETGRRPGAYTVMQTDGNLVVYSKAKKPLWYSNTSGYPGAALLVQDDGNLVIYQGKKALWSRHTAIGGLNAGQKLSAGNTVRSMNGVYSLAQQTDGNLVLYKDGKTPVWSTSTHGANTYALMQGDGNFVVYEGTKPLWGTSTTGHPGASLAVQDDGNLVVYGKDKTVLWAIHK